MRDKRKTEIKLQVAERLKKLCRDSDLVPSERGRNTAVANLLGKNIESVRRWFSGENLPEMQNLEEIANLFDANIGWILTGDGVPYRNQLTNSDEIYQTGMSARFLPVISFDDSAKFKGKYNDITILEWWPTDLKRGEYWLKVENDAMNNNAAQGIPKGCLILVDSKQTADPGDLALIIIGKSARPIFKQLTADGPSLFATSLNSRFDPISLISGEHRIIGKIIDAIFRPLRQT